MALTDESGSGMVMPVSPMYGGGNGYGFGDGGAWWLLILFALFAGNGWGGFGGGYGGNGALGYDFPWILNGQNGINNNVSDGFRDAQISDSLTSIRDGIGSLSTQMCNGFNSVNTNNMQTAFGLQSQLADCCCENRLATADLKYTIATEECATRSADAMNTRDIIDAQTKGTQAILDKLCALELDAKNDEIAQLRQEVLYARGQASQVAQNQQIVDSIYNRLDTCPVGTTPVYGRTPIFSCNNNSGCGCGAF